ncbi:hypothetical protein DPMN_044774 [Dreissena polymorpha]|uniref:Uncharacterized protein n=1 Tax=Dreissena polymorpha TaxID=45954 RepID=A0A9D4I0S3_DREPO|nr:hypothetical protein DPMN_044774 [Dreissena polymorpha]
MLMVYRITNDSIDIQPVRFFHHLTLCGHGDGHRFLVPFCRADVLKYSFFSSAIKLWNELKLQQTTAVSLEAFKRGLADTPKTKTELFLFVFNTHFTLRTTPLYKHPCTEMHHRGLMCSIGRRRTTRRRRRG